MFLFLELAILTIILVGLDAIKFGHEAIKIQIDAQKELVNEIGQKETREYESAIEDEDLLKKVQDECYENCYQIAKKGLGKKERSLEFSDVKENLLSKFSDEELEENENQIQIQKQERFHQPEIPASSFQKLEQFCLFWQLLV